MARLLLIDDDVSLREVMTVILQEAGHEVITAGGGQEGLELVASKAPDLVLTDMRMPGLDGMGVLRGLSGPGGPVVPVVVLTAYGTVEQAVAAMREGAYSYLLKPFERDELLLVIAQALRERELREENRRLHAALAERPAGTMPFLYASAAMEELAQRVRQVAPSDASVLIVGESGSGKELVAQAIHDHSPRRGKPLVAVDCASLPENLVEAELFGHERGAFTGADRSRRGRFRAATGGTLLLDEIGELSPAVQPRLLRVLETRRVTPVGAEKSIAVDIRVIGATNRELAAEVAAGRFREDLYYRLAVVTLHVPPLRERPEDVPLLWAHFTRLHAGTELPSAPALLRALAARSWPGNVRELKNLNQRLVLLRRGDELDVSDLETAAGREGPSGDWPGPLPAGGISLPELEKELVRQALRRSDGNKTRAAGLLGIPRHVLIYRLEKYGLRQERPAPGESGGS